MSQKSTYPKGNLIVWISANVLGFTALGMLVFIIPSIMSVSGIVPAILIISIPIGLAQWLALRRILPTSVLWIATIPVGVLLTVLLIRILPDTTWLQIDDESIFVLTGWYFVLGLSIGLPQWLLLRRHLSNSLIWVLGSSIAVAAGFGLVLITDLINRAGGLSYIVVVFTYSIITGVVLSKLLVSNIHSHDNLKNPV
jgi:hypothetical protein